MSQTEFKVASTMNGEPTQLDPNALYLVDFSKMSSVNDLVLILSAMGISFAGTHPHIEAVKPFLNLNNPIPMQQQAPKPQAAEIKLPKLKTL